MQISKQMKTSAIVVVIYSFLCQYISLSWCVLFLVCHVTRTVNKHRSQWHRTRLIQQTGAGSDEYLWPLHSHWTQEWKPVVAFPTNHKMNLSGHLKPNTERKMDECQIYIRQESINVTHNKSLCHAVYAEWVNTHLIQSSSVFQSEPIQIWIF